jgi:NADH-quinone oxidoreductase E subunit
VFVVALDVILNGVKNPAAGFLGRQGSLGMTSSAQDLTLNAGHSIRGASMGTSGQALAGDLSEPQPAVRTEFRFSEQSIAELNEIVSHYPEKRAAMLPALWIAQREYGGYLTPEALKEVAYRLERPFVEVEGVATFYTMYNFRPRGRHHLEVCTCLTCGVVGAYDVVHKLEQVLGCRIGETTKDGEFTLSEVECLDWCGAGTVIQVGDKYFGNVTADNVEQIIADLRKSDAHKPTDLANAVVRVLLPRGATPPLPTPTSDAPAKAAADVADPRIKPDIPPVAGDTPGRS